MSPPEAPIAHEGFFVTHFFTVRDQEKSTAGSSSILVVARLPTSQRSSSKPLRISIG
jgi:hypothetical protein